MLTGKYDASKGLILIGDGKGNFTAQTLSRSGLIINGDARSLVVLNRSKDQLLLAGINNDTIQQRTLTRKLNQYNPAANETHAVIELKDGRKRRVEFYHGNGYLSQSSGAIDIPGGSTRMRVYEMVVSQSSESHLEENAREIENPGISNQ